MARAVGMQRVWRILPVMLVCGWVSAGWAQTGPEIVFFGLLRADDIVVEPSETDLNGVPIFDRPFGSSFSLVVEAQKGASEQAVGQETFNEVGCPDMQVQVSRPLGDGSPAVCDTLPPEDGGVPATDPPELGDDPETCDALNDLGCRFVDGAGNTQGRPCSEGCVLFPNGEFGCAASEAEMQFCGRVAKSAEFPVGETLVTARVRDTQGNLGPAAQIIVRIAPPPPTITPQPTPTSTPVPEPEPRPTVKVKGRGCAIAVIDSDQTGSAPLAMLIPIALLWLARQRTGKQRRR